MKELTFQQPELQKLIPKIKATLKPFIRITPVPAPKPLSPLTSKFGGLFYVTSREEWPKDSLDTYMVPLAQINFEEVPPLLGYPSSGLLQIFISGDVDSSYGVGYDETGDTGATTKQKDFKVRYIKKEDVSDTYETDLSWHENYVVDMEGGSPIKGEMKLDFSADEEVMGLSDFRFDAAVTDQFNFFRDHEDAWQEYSEFQEGVKTHKIGGYPLLLEGNDRRKGAYEQHTEVLLQIDDARFTKYGYTYDQYRIDWGGGGVGYFFITPQDLKNLTFDNVLYWWEP